MANAKIRLWEKAGWIIIRSRETAKKADYIWKKSVICGMKNSRQQDRSGFGLPAHWKDFLTNECEEEKNCLWPVSEAKNPSCYGSFDLGKRTWGKWSSWRVLAGLEQKNWRILSVLPEESESWRSLVADEVKGSEIRI